jgi:hypothetical protein
MDAPPRERPATDKPFGPVLKWGVVAVWCGFLVWLLLPARQGIRSGRMPECHKRLKLLALAMHNYHDRYGSFPPAYVADKNGRPMHSWRALLLPFLLEFDTEPKEELRPLYNQYRFDEPWNGPHNSAFGTKAPAVFRCTKDDGPETDANYFVVVGPKTVFPGSKPVRLEDITDGTSNTILLVEAVDSGINWLEPRDLSYEEAVRGINPKTGLSISSHLKDGALVAYADGSVRYLGNDTPVEQLRRLLERNDGKPISLPENR